MSWWLMIALQAAPAIADARTFDLAKAAGLPTLTTLRRCNDNGSNANGSNGGEVVVCGRARDRYRLPLPTARAPLPGPVRGEAQTGMAALTPSRPCGIFAGERRCNKKEAAEYGYGDGRDPVTLLTRLARKTVDPDAD